MQPRNFRSHGPPFRVPPPLPPTLGFSSTHPPPPHPPPAPFSMSSMQPPRHFPPPSIQPPRYFPSSMQPPRYFPPSMPPPMSASGWSPAWAPPVSVASQNNPRPITPCSSGQSSTSIPKNPSSDAMDPRMRVWLLHIEPILSQRRLERRQKSIKLPEFRAKLAKWHACIQRLQALQTDDDGQPVPDALKNEVSTLERECCNHTLLNEVKEKLRRIRKKRRYLKRRKAGCEPAVSKIVPCSTADVLNRLHDSPPQLHEAFDLARNEDSTIHSFSDSSQTNKCNQLIPGGLLKGTKNLLEPLLTQCSERLALLDALEELRSARLKQAKQQGGLFPIELDLAFSGQIGELRNRMTMAITRLEETMPVNKNSASIQKSAKQQTSFNRGKPAELRCCDHFPDLPDWKKRFLFGDEREHTELPWRWKRFYHQADFDFSDFIRIRTAWDSLIVSDATEPTLRDERLPTTWIVPPELGPQPNNIAWQTYLVSSTD